MKASIILPKKEKSQYLLEVIETSAPSTVKKTKVKGGFSHTKKVVSALIVGLLMTLGIATSATAAGVTPTQSNAFVEDLAAGMFCSTRDSANAYLGGSSDTLTKGWNGDERTSPVGNGINITVPASLLKDNKPVGKWTALEQYGYYAPTFETWNGIYIKESDFKDKPAGFYGTGGGGTTESYGSLVGVENPVKSRFFNSGNALNCLNLGANFNVGVGNFLFGITKFAVAIASESYSVASTMVISTTDENSPLRGLSEGVEKLVTGDPATGQKGLKDILFLDWLVAIIFLGAIALAWTGLVKRSSLQAGQGALWMIGATVAGFLFVTYPMAVPGMVSTVVGEFNRSLTAALVQTNGSNDTLCTVKATSNASADSVRQVKCSIWYTTVYSPWVKGQFGMEEHKLNSTGEFKWMYSDTAESSRVLDGGKAVKTQAVPLTDAPEGAGYDAAKADAPANKAINASRGVFSNSKIVFGAEAYAGEVNWAIYMLDRQNNWAENRGVDYSEIAFNQLVVNKNSHWAGADDAVGSGFMSIFAAAGPVAILIALSFAMIGYQIAMLFLIVFSPLLFLLGVAPGWGRGIAMRWLELVAGLLVKQIVLALFLVLYVKLYMLVIQAGLEWWVQALVILVLSIVGISQRERITQMISGAINFGGDRRIDDGGQIRNQLAMGTRRTLDLAGRGTIATGRITKKGGAAALRSAPAAARKAKGAANAVQAKTKKAAGNLATTVKDARSAKTKIGHQGSERRQKAFDKVNAKNFDYSKLTDAERKEAGVREHSRRPGKYVVNRKQATKFINAKKAQFIEQDKQIQDRYKKSKIERRERMKTATTREERAEIKQKAQNERALAREQSRALHETTVKYFGEDRGKVREAGAKIVGRGKKPTYQTRKTNRSYILDDEKKGKSSSKKTPVSDPSKTRRQNRTNKN